ncbi:NAD-dependent epimerase/dehydratase family protein [Alkalihalobacterium chitinilyticum]|uniref:NAD-dependent epimerase/dehydratase family protein n=1 Tax=Alkalihalobacterium chitinilyticum TaxID=2980103 RepID=A0ABT5VB12_9BACI|nr:NAD-dependent epimerase/dehydratase family protein [Alkalihalobacterium chitinilyticum]MDE5412669.1 NAD-dependent epimerase/dehydratase family protein [Alkalihalobacterium chitinilyticum]
MKILVTGAAGFIGSHLCEYLLSDKTNDVIGVDGFLGFTNHSIKLRNLKNLLNHPRFQFVKEDLLYINWTDYLSDVDVIYHLAGMPGVRSSWGEDFKTYVDYNINVTQRLLEACRTLPIKKFIYASTSSAYGDKTGKVSEDSSCAPLSPYGVTKLTGEYLCKVYQENDSIPIVILRYFTVYGPRQRPDMAFHRFIKRMLLNEPIQVYGDGKQTRDFTFISDCVKGTAAVLYTNNSVIGETINIGGTERASVLDTISILEELLQKKANIQITGTTRGEPKHTWADISKAQKILHYQPKTTLKAGLQKEINDLKILYGEVD